jgi:hypothetical protein
MGLQVYNGAINEDKAIAQLCFLQGILLDKKEEPIL